MPLVVNYDPPFGWRLLKEGEPLENGDTYGGGGFKYIVGSANTTLKAGDPCPASIMKLYPIRKVVPQ